MVDALSRNAKLNFIASISSYKTELDDKLEEGVKLYEEYQNLREKVTENESENVKTNFSLNEKGLMLYKNRLNVPNILEIKLLIFSDVHKSPYSRHQGYQKMVTMLRKEYFWPNMKNEVAEFLARCIECQQVKVGHQHPSCLLQPLPIPNLK